MVLRLFRLTISKDTDLYKLYNTNIHEKIAEQKAKAKLIVKVKNGIYFCANLEYDISMKGRVSA